MKHDTLKKFFAEEIKDLYSAEKQLLKAIPKMRDAATNDKLRKGFDLHLKQTEGHVERLEQVAEINGFRPGGKTCDAMKGLVEEGESLLKEDFDPAVLDAALICAAQKVEHYEIGSYGCVCAYAKLMGDDKSLKLLVKTLDEEKATDEKLTQLAESQINEAALAGAH